MTQRITIEQTMDGAQVHKRAGDSHRGLRLEHEAEMLQRFRHPGVVEFVRLDRDNDVTTLVTRWVGPETAADLHPANLAQVGSLLAAVATTLADLHDAGMVHGRLQADHVLLAPSGRPVLCSLASCSSTEPSGGPGPLDDLRGVADMLTSLVARTPIPRGRRLQAQHDRLARSFLDLANTICGDETAGVPSARQLAQQLVALRGVSQLQDQLPEQTPAAEPAVILGGATAQAQGTRTWRDRVKPPAPKGLQLPGFEPAQVALLLVAAFLAGLFATNGLDVFDGSVTMEVTGQHQSNTAATTDGDEAPANVSCVTGSLLCDGNGSPLCAPPHATSGCSGSGCALVTAMAYDVDGDGCQDQVQVLGHMVQTHGTWYQAGQPGDLAAVGDWDCNGSDTVALLRTTTGQVFVFSTWVHDGATINVEAVATMPGAQTLSRHPQEASCDQLMVTMETGVQHAVVTGVL